MRRRWQQQVVLVHRLQPASVSKTSVLEASALHGSPSTHAALHLGRGVSSGHDSDVGRIRPPVRHLSLVAFWQLHSHAAEATLLEDLAPFPPPRPASPSGPRLRVNARMALENRRQFFSAENIAHNKKVLEYCRTSLCAVGGVVSGKLSVGDRVGSACFGEVVEG